jgi:hypothetical protein
MAEVKNVKVYVGSVAKFCIFWECSGFWISVEIFFQVVQFFHILYFLGILYIELKLCVCIYVHLWLQKGYTNLPQTWHAYASRQRRHFRKVKTAIKFHGFLSW